MADEVEHNPHEGLGISPQEPSTFRAVLEVCLAEHYGHRCTIERLEQRPFAYSTSCTIQEVDVAIVERGPLRLLAKDLGWPALLGDAARVRPRFMYDPRREITVYAEVLGRAALGTATCFGAWVDDRAGVWRLFLERVDGPKLCHVGDFPEWERAARWAAALHAAWGAAPPDAGALGLVAYDATHFGMWAERAARALAARSPDEQRRFGRLRDRYDRVVARLASLPRTFVHGEFYASNILLRPAPDGWQVCPVDWELAGVGPGVLDVAALTAGSWDVDRRLALVRAYADALGRVGVRTGRFAELVESVGYGRLHQAVQWLGWSADWAPPPDQAHDWLREALGLADELGVC